MGYSIGLDIGGSTTKIVGMEQDIIKFKTIVKAADPITSAYGAIGKLLNENNLQLENITQVNITGVGSSFASDVILGIRTKLVSEFLATGLGGLYLSGLSRAIVVSMGTGTAFIYSERDKIEHLIGSGVGGGTLIGLCNSMVGIDDAMKLQLLCEHGNISAVDLSICDISSSEIPGLPMHVTASNFGKIADDLSKEDKIKGVFNLVYQSIGTMAVLSSKLKNVKDVVFTGQLTTISECSEALNAFPSLYDVNFVIPNDSEYATAIGACLYGDRNQ